MAKQTRTYYTKEGKKGHIGEGLNTFIDTLLSLKKKKKQVKKKPKNKQKTTLAGGAFSADADAMLRALKEQ